MLQTIRVIPKNSKEDLAAIHLLSSIQKIRKSNGIKNISTAKIYRVEGVGKKEAEILAEKLFCESINQNYSINKPIYNRHSELARPERGRRVSESLRSRNKFGMTNNHDSGVVHVPQNDKQTVIEIAYKPGVMNPEVASIIKATNDLRISLLAADTSREYYFFGNVKKEELKALIEKLNLYNKTVEHIVEKEPTTLLIQGTPGPTSKILIRQMTDQELINLSQDKLFLNLEEMKVIQKYFQKIKRDPTDCELETLAQTWSEHSGHKTFKAELTVDGIIKEPLIKRIKKEALKHKKNIVSAFNDNSGVMDFYDGYAISGKVETHNSPSAIEPYGGAMTGSGGVFRDIVGTGQGGKTIVSTDIFCFAPPNFPGSKLPPGALPPQYLLKRVVEGVRDYGNRMGIPTNNGSVHFHKDFRAKPTVIVGAYGIVPKKYARIGKPKKGDLVICIGGKTGRDGIHGATFSSGEMTDRTISVNSSSVQIGNAIEEKRMFDAILEARDRNLIRAIQDVGGGGFSSAIGEIGKETGVTVKLENVELKYQGLSPWEIWVSESQERMILVISSKNLQKLKKICEKYNVPLWVLGTFDESKKLQVFYKKEKVCDISMNFLHNGLPQRKMTATAPRHSELVSESQKKKILNQVQDDKMKEPKNEKEWLMIVKNILSHPNVASKEPIVRLYDHTVQGTNVVQPFIGETLDGPTDAAVIRPLLDKSYGMVVSHGLNPILNNIDPYWGSIWACTEALANYVAVGGNPKEASLINNYIWPFPDEESLWSLDRSVDAVCDFMKVTLLPVISGKDSLSSTYRGKDGTVIKIPPVLCMSVFGRIKDVRKTTTSDFKKTDSLIYLVGQMDWEAMGGSIYSQVSHPEFAGKSPLHKNVIPHLMRDPENKHWIPDQVRNDIPHIDLKLLPKTLNAIYKGIKSGSILSCHDISEGGLFTILFEMCVGGNMGASISADVILIRRLAEKNLNLSHILFNETVGTFLIEVENKTTAEKLFNNIPYVLIGKTQKEKTISVQKNKKKLFNASLESLKKAWTKPMEEIFT